MFFLSGVILLLFVLRDVFLSVIPRGMNTALCIAPFLVRRIFWPPFLLITSKISSPTWKAEVSSLFAPFILVAMLIIWISLIAAAFGIIALALAPHYSPAVDSPMAAFYVSASSVLTIGNTSDFSPRTGDVKFLMLGGALIGMVLTASVVSLMFGLIAAIQPREAQVSIISNLGGSPPSGIAILETYSRFHGSEFLHEFFDQCHHWCADVLETHKSFPILPYFRSNDAFTSWLTALGAILDSIALMLAAAPERESFSARVMFQLGCKLLSDFVAIFELTVAEQEECSDDEFHQLYLRLQFAGYSSRSEDETRANFRLLRLEYLCTHRALCSYLAVPATSLHSQHQELLPALKLPVDVSTCNKNVAQIAR